MHQSLEEYFEFPTRLKSFLETNELNIADLFQLSLAELEKVPNFGPDTLNFISFFMKKNGKQFSGTTKIHEIVKDPYAALLSTKSKRLVDELSNDEVQQIRTLGPEGIVKLPRLSSVGEKTSREIYDYFNSTVFQQNTNSETHLEQKKPSHILTLSELSKDELELILTPLDYLNFKTQDQVWIEKLGHKLPRPNCVAR